MDANGSTAFIHIHLRFPNLLQLENSCPFASIRCSIFLTPMTHARFSVRPFVALVALVLCGAAVAQDAPASIRLLAFSRVGEPLEVAVAGTDGKPFAKEPIALPTQQLSPSRTVPSRTLVFTAPADAGKVLGKVTLPASEREFILIFLPAPKSSPLPYQVQAVPMPAAGFGSGGQAFVNFSGREVGCVIDGEKLQVPHGKAAVYQAAKSAKGAGNRTIVCYARKDGKWEDSPFFSSRLIIQDGVRNLILICLNPTTGEIDFRGVADFINP